jgi:phosphatidylglycerol lysyltransferase
MTSTRSGSDGGLGSERARALESLRQYGFDPISWQALESPFSYWFGAGGFVGYIDTGRAWVAAGMPVGPPTDRKRLTLDFIAAARAAKRRAVFFGADPALLAEIGGVVFRIGRRPYWSVATWDLGGHRRATLRYQLQRARRHGVQVRAIDPAELRDTSSPLRRQIDQLSAAWLDRRAMAPMGFVVSLELYVLPELHRYFAAEKESRLVGLLSAVPVFARDGWFAEDILRADDAPNGTAELLIATFFEQVRSEGARYATLGLAPLSGPLNRPLRLVRTLAKPLFDFHGLERFKEKMTPDGHEDRYIGAGPGTGQLRALIEVLAAFSARGFIRFGLLTLARGSLAVVGALTGLLLIWIPVLAGASTRTWFPSAGWHLGWVIFDLGLAAGLFRLCRGYRQRLAIALAAAVTADALATLAEALWFNLPRIQARWEWAVLAVGCAGPIAGSVALWTVVRRQARRYAIRRSTINRR